MRKFDFNKQEQEDTGKFCTKRYVPCESGHECIRQLSSTYTTDKLICDTCKRHGRFPIDHFHCPLCQNDYCLKCANKRMKSKKITMDSIYTEKQIGSKNYETKIERVDLNDSLSPRYSNEPELKD